MPEVLITHRARVFTLGLMNPTTERELKSRTAKTVLAAVVDVLSVPGTQAELNPEDVEVDFKQFDPHAVTNGFDCTIGVTATAYPERMGKEQTYSDILAKQLKFAFPLPGLRCYTWVKLVPTGFTEFRT